MPPLSSETLHATCIAIGEQAVLLTGVSGSGKSDLALRLIDRGAVLVSDDYTLLTRRGDALIASAPPAIAGRIEVRGLGLVDLPHRSDVAVALVVRLDAGPERMPDTRTQTIAGIAVPAITLAPLEASAPVKVELALKRGLWS